MSVAAATTTTNIGGDADYRAKLKQKKLDAYFRDFSESFEKTVIFGQDGKGDGHQQLHEPWGLFLGANGYLYVSEHKNNRVIRLHPRIPNSRTVVAGGNGKGYNKYQLNHPAGIFVDIDGSLFVADFGNNRIMKWPQGAEEGQVVAQVQAPRGIFIGPDFAMHVTTVAYNNAVLTISPFRKGFVVERGGTLQKKQGLISRILGRKKKENKEKDDKDKDKDKGKKEEDDEDSGNEDGPDEPTIEWTDRLLRPEQILLDGDDIIVADSGNNCISKLNPVKEQLQPCILVQGSKKFVPTSFAMDSAYGIYCADEAKRKIVRHGTRDNTMQIIFTGDHGDFFPRGIVLDKGDIYACNWGRNHEIVKISEKGKASDGHSLPFDPNAPDHSWFSPSVGQATGSTHEALTNPESTNSTN